MVIHVGKAWRGRLVNWVEKLNFDKIPRLLEVYERERHFKVLLTPENIYVVRHNPAPYNLSVIPALCRGMFLKGSTSLLLTCGVWFLAVRAPPEIK